MGKKNHSKTFRRTTIKSKVVIAEQVSVSKQDKIVRWIILSVFFCAFLLFTPLGQFSPKIPPQLQTGYHSLIRMDAGDDAGYYSYLRSVFFDRDIDFFNEKGFYHFDHITDTGYTISYWAIGSAILWFSFFFFGHGSKKCL